MDRGRSHRSEPSISDHNGSTDDQNRYPGRVLSFSGTLISAGQTMQEARTFLMQEARTFFKKQIGLGDDQIPKIDRGKAVAFRLIPFSQLAPW
jgi:hypothetical protein